MVRIKIYSSLTKNKYWFKKIIQLQLINKILALSRKQAGRITTRSARSVVSVENYLISGDFLLYFIFD